MYRAFFEGTITLSIYHKSVTTENRRKNMREMGSDHMGLLRDFKT
jgi:hypothetical protein